MKYERENPLFFGPRVVKRHEIKLGRNQGYRKKASMARLTRIDVYSVMNLESLRKSMQESKLESDTKHL